MEIWKFDGMARDDIGFVHPFDLVTLQFTRAF